MKYPILLPNIFNYPFTYESNLDLKVGEYYCFRVTESEKISNNRFVAFELVKLNMELANEQ